MKRRVLKTRNIILFITVFLSTLMIEFILVFLQGCSDGVGLAFDIDKQAFVVEQGCVCGGCLYFSGEDAADEFSVIIIRMYTPFGMIVTIHLSLKSTTSPLVVMLFYVKIPCFFVAFLYDQTPPMKFTVCQVAAGLLPLLSRPTSRVG